jgi:hypothetical protein
MEMQYYLKIYATYCQGNTLFSRVSRAECTRLQAERHLVAFDLRGLCYYVLSGGVF